MIVSCFNQIKYKTNQHREFIQNKEKTKTVFSFVFESNLLMI